MEEIKFRYEPGDKELEARVNGVTVWIDYDDVDREQANAVARMIERAANNELAEYQKMVREVWKDGGSNGLLTLRGLFVCTTGLAGETGEVLEPIKKAVRRVTEEQLSYGPTIAQLALDDALDMLDRQELANEMGDVLYYLTRLGQRWGISLQEMMRLNTEKLEKRYGNSKPR